MIKVPREKLIDVQQQVKLMKLQLDHLKQVRSLEVQRQQDFIQNCGTIMAIIKEQQKDYLLEQIIQMDESV